MAQIVVTSSWTHMSGESGLNPLIQEIKKLPVKTEWVGVNKLPLGFRINDKLARIFQRRKSSEHPQQDPSPFVTPFTRRLGRCVTFLAERRADSSILLLAGEDLLTSSLVSNLEIMRRTSCLFHQPPSWFKLHWRDAEALSKLDKIFVLSSDQQSYFQSMTDRPVRLVKHGVSHRFFRPSPRVSQDRVKTLLFVGQWLRDFKTLKESFEIISNEIPSTKLICVIPWHARHSIHLLELAKNPNVDFLSGISKEHLLRCYQEADLLFLPLIDATANNAIVEALACGVPVVSSAVGGNLDYIDKSFCTLARCGNSQDHANAVLWWLSRDAERVAAGQQARKYSECSLNWSLAAKVLTDS